MIIKQSTTIMQPCITTANVCSMYYTTGVSQMWVSEPMGGGQCSPTPLLVNAVNCKWTTENQGSAAGTTNRGFVSRQSALIRLLC